MQEDLFNDGDHPSETENFVEMSEHNTASEHSDEEEQVQPAEITSREPSFTGLDNDTQWDIYRPPPTMVAENVLIRSPSLIS